MKTLRTVLLTLAICLTCAVTAFCDAIAIPVNESNTGKIFAALLILACLVVTIVLIVRTRKRK